MRNPDYTRNLIVSKAMPIFNTKGYRATSISDITKATGLTKGAIYGNFANKDAVAVASFEHAVQLILGDLHHKISQAPTAPLKLKAIAGYYREYIPNPPIQGGCPVINTSIEADDNYPLLRTRVVRFIGMIKESLAKIVYRGIREKQLKETTNVEEFVAFFYAAIKGAIMISRVEGDLSTYNHVFARLEKEIDQMTY